MLYDGIFSKFQDQHILVLGDLIVDEYIWGQVARISPEAPVPIVEVRSESFRPGGAANVAANIQSLGGQASIVGLVGDDALAGRLLNALEALGIKGEGVVVDQSRPTTVKTRVLAGSQHVVRFDRESHEEPGEEIVERLLERVVERLPSADALLISDYAKGVISRGLVEEVFSLARDRRKLVVVDPKVHHFFLYKKATVITPNAHEAAAIAGKTVRTEEDLLVIGKELLSKVEASALLVTRGEQGMSLFEREGNVTHIPTVAREVYDVTGAGDTVVASLTLALASGATMREAATIANYAASVVVGKRGTATASLAEVHQALKDGGKA